MLEENKEKFIVFDTKKERATSIAIMVVGRAITIKKINQEKKQRTEYINEAKKIMSNNFKGSNREKSIIAIKISKVKFVTYLLV